MDKRICAHCEKHLVKIGKGRKNGSQYYTDWRDRPYHIECLKIVDKKAHDEYKLTQKNIAYMKKDIARMKIRYADNADMMERLNNIILE